MTPTTRSVIHRVSRVVIAVGICIGSVLLPAVPAQAHTKGEPAAIDYRTTLREVTPAMPGLTVRVVQGDTRLELNNRTGRTLDVLGYSAEPYLRITPKATYVNTHSPSAYRNEDLDANQAAEHTGSHTGTEADGATTPADWRKLTDSSRVRWHDHRTHWMSDSPPPAVQQAPGQHHRIADWSITLRPVDTETSATTETPTTTATTSKAAAQTTDIQLRGTLEYLPPPQTGVWWAGMLALVAGLVAVVVTAARHHSARRYLLAGLGGLLLTAATAELIDSTGRALDAGATGFGIGLQLLTTETYGTLTAVAALVTAGVALRGHPTAPFALALSATCLTVLGALTDVAVFSHSIATVPWSGELARLCAAATLTLGAAVAIGGWRIITADRAWTPQSPARAPAADTAV